MIKRIASVSLVALSMASAAHAEDFQGTIADWTCTQRIVQQGRAKVEKNAPECSLTHNYSRAEYGLVTDNKQVYKLDDAGRAWALQLLKDTSNKDNLHVIVRGTLEGNLIHVKTMSEL